VRIRPARAAALAVLGAFVLLLLGAPAASAHATLVSTSPTRGSEVTAPPVEVLLRFSEPVAVDRRSVTVQDPFGFRIDYGEPDYPGGDLSLVRIRLRGPLARQSYLVVWRVVSADGHPAEGSFTFGYGVPARPATDPGDLSDPVLVGLHGLARWAGLAGTTVLAGGAFFVVLLWRPGWERRPVRRLLVAAWAVSVASTLALLVLQGPYGASLRLADVTDPGLLGLTLGTLVGKLFVLRLVALLGAFAVWWQGRRRSAAPGRWDVAGLALLAAESFSFAGHQGQGTLAPVTATVDAAHLLAAAVWIGGLVVLVIGLLPVAAASWQGDDVPAVLRRWSRVAMVAVAVLVVTGTVQAWRGVGAWGAVTSTAYGRLVLLKVGLLVVVLAGAELSRRAVRVLVPAAPPGLARLRLSVAAEAGLLAVVLGVTAALVATVPGWQAYAPSYAATAVARGATGDVVQVRVVVDPVRLGNQTISVGATRPDGTAVPLTGLAASLTQPQLGLGPVAAQGRTTGPGRAEALVTVPDPGRWTLELRLLAAPPGAAAAAHPGTDAVTYVATLTYDVE
jgi:copper transport protein